jgi:phosphate transport system substrate-binding protein
MLPDIRRTARVLLPVLALSVASAACGGGAGDGGSGATISINGAGATFPTPIYSRWTADYHALHPNIQINYQSLGSGAGIRQLLNQTVFFGASDSPMTDEQLANAPGPIVHLPTVLGAVVPVYNVSGVSQPLNFTGPVLADIFLGAITKWNDPAIATINPGAALPATDITVVHRSDGSGTTFIWVEYLAKVSPAWKDKVGVGTSVNWPVGLGGKGNEGVTGLVQQTPGAIGYVELVYALQNTLAYGAVQNAAGEFVRATVESVTAAAAGAASSMPADFRVSITNAPGPGAYPIASYTWLLLWEQPTDMARSRVMVDFVRWAVTDGQRTAAEMGYAPLPPAVVERVTATLSRIRIE